MLAEKNFYTIQSFSHTDGSVQVTIEINQSHNIFEGHFPGQPVVPGVCMLQIVKELSEKALGNETRLVQADNLKFLSIINPVENNIAEVAVKYIINPEKEVEVTATISNRAVTCFKMKGVFKPVQ